MFDGAMIAMRYALNLAHGHGLVWNVGERAEGYGLLGEVYVPVDFRGARLPHFKDSPGVRWGSWSLKVYPLRPNGRVRGKTPRGEVRIRPSRRGDTNIRPVAC